MRFTYNDKKYDFDVESLTVAEGREVKKFTGLTLNQWQKALEEVDADAMAALVYTAVRRGGGVIEWSDLDSMNLVDFANSIVEDNHLDRDALARGEVSVLTNRAERRAKPTTARTARSK